MKKFTYFVFINIWFHKTNYKMFFSAFSFFHFFFLFCLLLFSTPCFSSNTLQLYIFIFQFISNTVYRGKNTKGNVKRLKVIKGAQKKIVQIQNENKKLKLLYRKYPWRIKFPRNIIFYLFIYLFIFQKMIIILFFFVNKSFFKH